MDQTKKDVCLEKDDKVLDGQDVLPSSNNAEKSNKDSCPYSLATKALMQLDDGDDGDETAETGPAETGPAETGPADSGGVESGESVEIAALPTSSKTELLKLLIDERKVKLNSDSTLMNEIELLKAAALNICDDICKDIAALKKLEDDVNLLKAQLNLTYEPPVTPQESTSPGKKNSMSVKIKKIFTPKPKVAEIQAKIQPNFTQIIAEKRTTSGKEKEITEKMSVAYKKIASLLDQLDAKNSELVDLNSQIDNLMKQLAQPVQKKSG